MGRRPLKSCRCVDGEQGTEALLSAFLSSFRRGEVGVNVCVCVCVCVRVCVCVCVCEYFSQFALLAQVAKSRQTKRHTDRENTGVCVCVCVGGG